MYQRMSFLRKTSLILGIAMLLLGLVPGTLAGVAAVYAEGVVPPVEEPDADAPAEEPVSTGEEPAPAEEVSAESSESEGAVVSDLEMENIPAEEGDAQDDTALISEIVADAAEKEVELVDENGEVLDLASQETANLLEDEVDPWFEDGGVIYGYSASASCVSGVDVCNANLLNPIQDAIDAAPAGATIYIKPDAYYLGSEVTVNKDVTLLGVAGTSTVDLAPSNVIIGTINLGVDINGWLNVYANIVNVIDDAAEIQDAIDIAADGATVNVAEGTYEEELTIDQSLVLNGDVGNPTVSGPGSNAPTLKQTDANWQTGTGIFLNSSNVTIQGFILKGFEDGVDINGQTGADINNNLFLYKPISGDAIAGGIPDIDAFNIKFGSEVNGKFYNNECDSSVICQKEDGGGDGSDLNTFGVGETYDIDANVVVIKAGTEEFFYTPDTQDCNPATSLYCVFWNFDNTITIIRYQAKHAISHVQFWNFEEPECEGEFCEPVYGCLDPSAANYDPQATVSDEYCEYNLELDPYCLDTQDGYKLVWEIINPNSFNVDAVWTLDGANGAGSLAPGVTFIGYTDDGPESHTLNASWEFGEDSYSSSEVCAPVNRPPEDPEPPTFLAVVEELIIPVTGAELAGQNLLSFGGMLLVGLSLLAKGVSGKIKK